MIFRGLIFEKVAVVDFPGIEVPIEANPIFGTIKAACKEGITRHAGHEVFIGQGENIGPGFEWVGSRIGFLFEDDSSFWGFLELTDTGVLGEEFRGKVL